MEKNNQPLIITSIVAGAVLIIALALIFTRGNDDPATETVSENNTSANQESENTQENGSNGQQPAPAPQPQPAPVPEPIPVPTPTPQPQPQSDGLPSDWNSLTSQQKTNLNPFDCDHESQYVRADNGQCVDKLELPQSEDLSFIIDEPLAVIFDNGLELEVTARMECIGVEKAFRDTYDPKFPSSVVVLQFFEYLEENGINTPEIDWLNLDHAAVVAFFDLAVKHATDQCVLISSFKNIGENYNYTNAHVGCHDFIFVSPKIHQGDSLRDSYLANPGTTNPLIWFCPVEPSGGEDYFVQGATKEVWQEILLPAGYTIESLHLTVDVRLSGIGRPAITTTTQQTLTLFP